MKEVVFFIKTSPLDKVGFVYQLTRRELLVKRKPFAIVLRIFPRVD